MQIEQLVSLFLSISNQVKLLHWQTEIYAEHEALGEFYAAWNELTDSFIESYAGLYGRPKGGVATSSVAYGGSVTNYIIQVAAQLTSQNVRSVAPETALQNILDEMGALSMKTAYLLTMK
jgi:hypothetical protein